VITGIGGDSAVSLIVLELGTFVFVEEIKRE